MAAFGRLATTVLAAFLQQATSSVQQPRDASLRCLGEVGQVEPLAVDQLDFHGALLVATTALAVDVVDPNQNVGDSVVEPTQGAMDASHRVARHRGTAGDRRTGP